MLYLHEIITQIYAQLCYIVICMILQLREGFQISIDHDLNIYHFNVHAWFDSFDQNLQQIKGRQYPVTNLLRTITIISGKKICHNCTTVLPLDLFLLRDQIVYVYSGHFLKMRDVDISLYWQSHFIHAFSRNSENFIYVMTGKIRYFVLWRCTKQ